jgi:hypothetical protein
MAYGHAERNLALIRQLEAETRRLLANLDQADAGQSATLIVEAGKHAGGRDVVSPREHRAESPSAGQLPAGEDVR